MFKVHAYVDNVMYFSRRLEHLPRIGDTVRMDGEEYAKVIEVIWCWDESSSEGERVNLRLGAEKKKRPRSRRLHD